METQRRVLGIALVTALLVGFAWLVWRPHGPRYRGRPLSFWFEQAHVNGDYEREGVTTPAELALRERGTNALPLLLEMASTPLDGFRSVVGDMSRDDSSAFLHLPPQLYKNDLAAWGFRLLGPDARPAVPALARLLTSRSRDLQLSGLASLAAIGTNASEAVPEILGAFQRSSARLNRQNPKANDSEVCCAAAYALGEIGPAAAAAIPSLTSDTNEFAIVALMRIRRESFDPFFQRLRDTSNDARWQRVAAEVHRLGTRAEGAVPHLLAALASTNYTIHFQALQEIGHIHRRPDLCLPVLIPLLQPSNDWFANTPGQVLSALGEFGPAAKPAFADVARLLKNRDESIRMNASNTLLAIDPVAAARVGVRPNTNDLPAHR